MEDYHAFCVCLPKNFFKSLLDQKPFIWSWKKAFGHTHTNKRHFLAYTLSENIIEKLKVTQ